MDRNERKINLYKLNYKYSYSFYIQMHLTYGSVLKILFFKFCKGNNMINVLYNNPIQHYFYPIKL